MKYRSKHHLIYRLYRKPKDHLNLMAGLLTVSLGLMANGYYVANADTTIDANNQNTVTSNATSQSTSSASSNATSSATSASSSQNSASSSVSSSITSSATSSSSSNTSSAASSNAVSANDSANASVTSSAVSSANKSAVSSANSASIVPTSNATLSDQLASLQAANPQLAGHLKMNGQNIYYYNNSNKPASSLLLNNNGQLTYFDADGKWTQLPQSTITTGLQTIMTDWHNQIYSLDGKSIDNTDGYITANAWYRPQYILKDGKTWTESTSQNFRPVLSVWWPSKTMQVKYINYMKTLGLGVSSLQYTNDTSQDALNAAAKDIQANVEKRISDEDGNTEWLKDLINNFVKQQPQWNMTSEIIVPQTFQGGTLTYNNSDQTKYANSNYRLLNRYPTNQTGIVNRQLAKLQGGGSEFLLANDVDNSNPAVQAEQLNWLYYLMNFGTITNQGKDANFDSYRVDAVDNVDADLLQVASNYFKAAYKVDKNDKTANAHIPILEDWSFSADPQYVKQNGANQLTMDYQFKAWEAATLMKSADQRISLSNMIKTLVNRTYDTTNNKAIPNYSFIRAHDSEVQTIIQKIITNKIDPNSSGTTFTQGQLAQAFKIYDADEKSTNKQFTPYNIPAGYALLLTNKDTVPRIYYGDMYTDDGQYMAHKTPYYNAIQSLLRNRIKYVAGGQAMNVATIDGNEVLTSVRYGKGILKPNQKSRAKIARTSGMALLMTNNPTTKFKRGSKIAVTMGKNHANQRYQLALQSTKRGISMNERKYLTTNRSGVLMVPASYLRGYANPQVSGSISMWVPVGAKRTQDIRVKPSAKKSKDGQTYHSNPALDSNVLFEGFSNFQSMPTKTSQYTNVVIAKQAKRLAKLGITYFEFAPQYRSSTDSSFIDSIVKNGYSFTDRYDLGFNNADGSVNPTKYGTAQQLADAIKAVHKAGMKAIADWVPDQVYNLPQAQIVSATRTDNDGNPLVSTNFSNTLYYAHTEGNGTDYQAKYGGAFLAILKQKYPQLFNQKMISNDKTLPTNEPITQWSAKYFNGTNIQGPGIDYVLSNADQSGYFTVPTDETDSSITMFLPQQLLGNNVSYGFVKNGDHVQYQTVSGYLLKNGFYQADDGNYYYFDADGNMVTKPTTIDGSNYYFLSNGVNLRNVTINQNGQLYYYQGDGKQLTKSGNYTIKTVYPPLNNTDDDNIVINTNIRVNQNGTLATGLAPSSNGTLQFFNDDGTQVMGGIVNVNGQLMDFDASDGNLVTDQFFQVPGDKLNWYHANKNGIVSVGLQKINGQYNYFDQNGVQVKGAVVKAGNQQIYLDSANGQPVKNQLVEYNDKWYYAGFNTYLVTGWFKYQGAWLYFGDDGAQVKGAVVKRGNHLVYLDPGSGQAVKNRLVGYGPNWYYAGKNTHLITGWHKYQGQTLYFGKDHVQVKGQIVHVNNHDFYLTPNDGSLMKNQDVTIEGQKYHANRYGHLMKLN